MLQSIFLKNYIISMYKTNTLIKRKFIGGLLKTVLIEINEKRNSLTTYFKKDNNNIYKWTIHHLSKLSAIKSSYLKMGVEVTLVLVRD